MFNRKRRFVLSTLILFAVLATNFLATCAPQTATNIPTDSCGPIEPSDKDVQYALSFGKDLFNTAKWVKSYTVEPYKVSVSRHNDTEGSVAYLEYLMYNCGYNQTDLNNYFNDAGFNVVFGDYDTHKLAHFCEIKSLALYEYDLVSKGENYFARYWVKQDSGTRVLVVMLVFPTDSQGTMDRYTKQLFPQLTSCPNS